MNKISRQDVHTFIHILALAGIASGLSVGKAIISISFVLLVVNILMEAKFKEYARNIKSSPILYILVIFYLYHIISLLWSSNLSFALHDLKVKLPLLFIPLIIAVRSLPSKKHVSYILNAFIFSAVLISIINFGAYHQWFGERTYDDIRGMSLFGHHIRFALLITFSIAILLTFLDKSKYKLLLLLLIIWLSFYTFHSQVLSGIMTLFAVMTIYVLRYIWYKSKLFTVLIGGSVMLSVFIALYWIFKPIHIHESRYKNLPQMTINGNPYSHDFKHVSPESGQPIGIHLSEKEISNEWNKVSAIDYFDSDKKGRLIRLTLIRYMASKGLKKDSVGFSKLDRSDIENIEKGIPGDYTFDFMERFYALKFQLINEKNPNGHSLLMRLEFWKAGMAILKENFLFGTGTGDVQDAFHEEYEKNNSPLSPENRNRAHNMYLTFALSLGIPGLLIFIWFHYEFIRLNLRRNSWIGIYFITIILISYLMEDTLESQVGVTFFALFTGLFGCHLPEKE